MHIGLSTAKAHLYSIPFPHLYILPDSLAAIKSLSNPIRQSGQFIIRPRVNRRNPRETPTMRSPYSMGPWTYTWKSISKPSKLPPQALFHRPAQKSARVMSIHRHTSNNSAREWTTENSDACTLRNIHRHSSQHATRTYKGYEQLGTSLFSFSRIDRLRTGHGHLASVI